MIQRMKVFFQRWSKSIVLYLAIMGPGLVTAFADNDAGGVATYSVAAAKFGYQILLTLIPITAVLAITQEIGARIAIVTGKGLADLIRERYGVFVSFVVFAIVFMVNFGVILQDLSGLKSGLQLFGFDYRIFLPLTLVVLFIFLVNSNYHNTERLFLIVMLFYLTYLFSAILVKPDWGFVFKSMFVPQGKMSFDYLYTSIAVLGTTVTAWGQFVIASSINDKKLTPTHLKYNRMDVISASIISNTFTMFMIVAVAATLWSNHVLITDAAGASLAIRPLAGDMAGVFFGAGLLAAGFLGCAIVPLSTAYAFSELFGLTGSLDHGFRKGKFFYMFFLFQVVLASIFVMQPSFSLFQITLYADFFNGMVLPLVFFFLYKFANDEELMGKYKNTKIQNIILISIAVIISFAGLLGGASHFLKF